MSKLRKMGLTKTVRDDYGAYVMWQVTGPSYDKWLLPSSLWNETTENLRVSERVTARKEAHAWFTFTSGLMAVVEGAASMCTCIWSLDKEKRMVPKHPPIIHVQSRDRQPHSMRKAVSKKVWLPMNCRCKGWEMSFSHSSYAHGWCSYTCNKR
jgi:hypothetical protein